MSIIILLGNMYRGWVCALTGPGIYLAISFYPQGYPGSSALWGWGPDLGSWPWSSPASCFVFSIGLTPKTLVFTEMLHVAAAPVSPSAHGMYLLNSSVNRPRAFFVDPGTCGGILCVGRWDWKNKKERDLVIRVALSSHTPRGPLARDTSWRHGLCSLFLCHVCSEDIV